MKTFSSLVCGTALALVLASGTMAQEASLQGGVAAFEEFYAKLNVGIALPGTIRIDGSASTSGAPGFSGTMSFNPGPMIAVGLGTHLTENIRGELEFTVARNTASSYSAAALIVPNGWASGTVTTAALSAVAYYDFTQFGDFVPYLSGGLAVVNISTSDLMVQVNTDGVTSGSSTVGAIRVGAGFQYAMTENVTLGVDYFAMIGGRNTLTFNDPVGPPPFSRTITSDTMAHALSASFKVKF